MSKTLHDLVYSIKEAVSNFEITDDDPISDLWLEDQIISQNHTLIRKALKERSIDDQLYQIHEPIKLKEFDNSINIDGVRINSNSKLCYGDTPSILTGLRGMEVEFVSNLSYDTVYTREPLKRLLRKSSGYYDSFNIRYALMPGKVFFKSGHLGIGKYVSINAIWSDPREVSSWDPGQKFPTPSEKNLEILTIQHVAHAMQFPMDLINDAQRAVGMQKSKETSND